MDYDPIEDNVFFKMGLQEWLLVLLFIVSSSHVINVLLDGFSLWIIYFVNCLVGWSFGDRLQTWYLQGKYGDKYGEDSRD